MRWMTVLVLAFAMGPLLPLMAQDGERVTVSQALARLVEAQAQVQSACAAAGVTVPSGLSDVLIVRRTIAADWQRRLDGGTVKTDDAALLRFTGELENLVAGLQQLTNLAQQLGDAPRRFPHCLREPAFLRYRTLVNEAVDQGMQALVAGRLRDQVAPSTWYQRQSRHTALLTVIEASQVAEEHYASLPRDDHWLIEYREHLLLTRATLERTLEQSEAAEPHQAQQILDAYTRLLDARVQNELRISECGLEATSPEVVVFRQAATAHTEGLGRLVVLARSDAGDEERASQQRDHEQRKLSALERLKDMADQWLSFEVERRAQAESFNESFTDIDAALAEPFRKELAALDTAERAAQTAFATAVTAGDLDAALTAQHAAEQARQRRDRRANTLSEDLVIAQQEHTWRAHAKDPAIAEKLRQWDERRTAVLAARRAADEASTTALLARQAAERADLLANRAEEHASELDEAAGQTDLSDLINALNEMVELRAGAQPAP